MTDLDSNELHNAFDDDVENRGLADDDNDKKYKSKDPVAESLIAWYKFWCQNSMLPIRLAVYLTPIISFVAFSVMISNS